MSQDTAPEAPHGPFRSTQTVLLHGQGIRTLMRKWSKLTVEQEEMRRTERLHRTMNKPPRWSPWQHEQMDTEVRQLGEQIRELLADREAGEREDKRAGR